MDSQVQAYKREAEDADRKAKYATDPQTKQAYATISEAYRLLAVRASFKEGAAS